MCPAFTSTPVSIETVTVYKLIDDQKILCAIKSFAPYKELMNSSRALSKTSTPLSTLQMEIEIEANKRWYRLYTCATAKSLWPVYDKKRSINLMELSRRDI